MILYCGHTIRDEEEDLVEKAENDFWYYVNQEKQDWETKERKRAEAAQAKNQPTPIPEEGGEQLPSVDKGEK